MESGRTDFTNWTVVGGILGRIRDQEHRQPGESIEDFMKRTYQMAMAEYEAGPGRQSILPEREAIRQRSATKYEQVEAEAAAVDTEPAHRMPRRKK